MPPTMYEEEMGMPFGMDGKGADGHTLSTRKKFEAPPYVAPSLTPRYEGQLFIQSILPTQNSLLQNQNAIQSSGRTIDSLVRGVNVLAPYHIGNPNFVYFNPLVIYNDRNYK